MVILAHGPAHNSQHNQKIFKNFSDTLEFSKLDHFGLETLFLKDFLCSAIKIPVTSVHTPFPIRVPAEQMHGSLLCPRDYSTYLKDDCKTCLYSTLSSPWLDLSNTILTSNSSFLCSSIPVTLTELPAVLNVRCKAGREELRDEIGHEKNHMVTGLLCHSDGFRLYSIGKGEPGKRHTYS